MRASSTLKFLAIWAVFAGVTVAALVVGEAPPEVASPIANLAVKTGDVDVRSQDLLLWQRAQLQQPFGSGDRISTGADSGAKIALTDGRVLEVGADSLIILSNERPHDPEQEQALVVTVNKGTLKVAQVEAPPATAPAAVKRPRAAKRQALQIHVDGKAVELKNAVDTVAIEKKADAPATIAVSADVVVKKQIIVATPPPPPPEPDVEAPLPAPTIATQAVVPALVPAPPPAPPPPLVADGLAPDLEIFGSLNPAQINLWTSHDLTASHNYLSVRIRPPSGKDVPVGLWTPLLRGGDTLVEGRPEFSAQNVLWPLPPLRGGAARSQRLALTTGVRLTANGQVARAFAEHTTAVTMQALDDLSGGAVHLLLDVSRPADALAEAGWFLQDDSLSAQGAATWQFTLRDGHDLSQVLPLLKEARAIKIEATDFNSLMNAAQPAVWLVRGQRLIAKVGASGDTASIRAGQLLRALDADLAYLGRPTAVQALGDSAPGSQLYVANHARGEAFYALSTRFVRTYANVKAFLRSSAVAFFNEPVVVVANRGQANGSAAPREDRGERPLNAH